MEITDFEKDSIDKSIFPELENSKFEIDDNIKGKKLYIGEALSSFYDFNQILALKKKEKVNIKEKRKSRLKNLKLNMFLKSSLKQNQTNSIGKTENPILPRASLIEKLKRNEKSKNILSFSSDLPKIRLKESSSLSNSTKANNDDIKQLINSKTIKIRKRKNFDRNHSKSYNNTLIQSLRILDFKNGKVNKQIKKDKKKFDNVKNNMINRYRIYHWKYIMSDNEKDLRPDTFFGKAGAEVLNKQKFNKRLDNMINHLKNVDVINIGTMINRHREHLTIEEKLKKRVEKENEKIELIHKILESDQMICNNIKKE